MSFIKSPLLNHSLRIIIGLVFIVSAVFKLIGVDAFEIYIFSFEFFGLPLASILARLIISSECIIGVLLILNINFDVIKKITAGILAAFSVFLTWQIIQGNNENCHCFGEIIQFTPTESLLKNILLLIFLFAIWKNSGFNIKHASSLRLFLIVFVFVFPMILIPPDFMLKWPQMEQNTLEIASKRAQNNPNLQAAKITEGKKIVCMLSTKCGYCVRAANIISVIAEKNDLNNAIVYVFFGEPTDLPEFWKESNSTQFDYTFLPSRAFFEIAGPSIPSIYLSDNGVFTQQFNYRNIDEQAIIDFLK